MALKAFIKDLSAVEESQQGLYKEIEGGYVLEVEPADGYDLQNVSGLKNALQKLKGDYEQAKTTLKSFGELDPQDALRKLERYEKLKDLNPEKLKKELKLEAQELVSSEYKAKIEAANQKADSLKSAVRKAAMQEVNAAIAATGANPVFLEGYLSKVADVEFNDDGYELVFKNKTGEKRFNIDDKGNSVPFTANDLVKELQKDETYGQIFPSNSNSGGGGQTQYRTSKNGVKIISPADKHNYQEEIAAGTVEVDYG